MLKSELIFCPRFAMLLQLSRKTFAKRLGHDISTTSGVVQVEYPRK